MTIPASRQSIELFLCPADSDQQTLEDGLDRRAMAETGATDDDTEPSESHHNFFDLGGDPNSLEDQGWGVVAPAGARGDRLLGLIHPLLDKRAVDQGRDVVIHRVEPGMNPIEAMAWVDGRFVGNLSHDEIPGYVLVLGELAEISLAVQQVLSSTAYVGRLGFDHDDHYAAYVDKILAHESGPGRDSLPRALFFTARDGTPATTAGRELLIRPSLADAREQKQRGRFPVAEILDLEGVAAEAGDLLLDAAGADHPSLLLSCSHGMGAPRKGWRSADHQRAMQGALCLGGKQRIAGDALLEQPFLPGGMWFYFACFSAGTPASSAYHHWLRRLKELGEFGARLDAVLAALPRMGDPPFLAALPKAVLANPRGPLAVMGHLDLAWSYAFQDMDAHGESLRHRRFQSVLRHIVRGSRVGIALRSLHAARELARADLLTTADALARGEQPAGDPLDVEIRLGHRWMSHQDLDGYVLLGDPAARLALAPPARAPAASRRDRDEASDPAPSPLRADPATEIVTEITSDAGLDLDQLEDAVHEVIAAEQDPAAIAAEYGVSESQISRWHEVYTEAGRAALAAMLKAARETTE